jgi:hypothetical protein
MSVKAMEEKRKTRIIRDRISMGRASMPRVTKGGYAAAQGPLSGSGIGM